MSFMLLTDRKRKRDAVKEGGRKREVEFTLTYLLLTRESDSYIAVSTNYQMHNLAINNGKGQLTLYVKCVSGLSFSYPTNMNVYRDWDLTYLYYVPIFFGL